MSTSDPGRGAGLRYQADERPPAGLAFGLALQLAVLAVVVPVMAPAAVMRVAGATEAHVSWAVFAAVVVCGAATVLQTVRFGRIGSGHVLVMGSSGAFIGICIIAVAEGGVAMLATLVVVSALFQLLLAARLALFRRFLTPTVSGTVIMLVPVTVMPFLFGMATEVPDGSPAHGAVFSALATLLVTAGIMLKGTGAWRLWAPVAGIAAGSAVAGSFGLYDVDRIPAASWIGLPESEWPGLDLDFGPVFWSLLPAFLLATLISTLRTVGSSVAVQGVSWRRRRAVDFQAVQGAVTTDGASNLLCGLAGTIPNTTYAYGASFAEITGVASRAVGVATGAMLIPLALSPKALAILLAVPGPVLATYVAVLLALLFLIGVRMIVRSRIDRRRRLIVVVAFLTGAGFQFDLIFPEQVAAFAGGLFRNGLTTGGLAAILLTLLVEWTEPRAKRVETELALSALPGIREFLRAFARSGGCDTTMADRLDAVGEEVLLTLAPRREAEGEHGRRRVQLAARKAGDGAILEFVVAPVGENLEDRIALLGTPFEQGEAGEAPSERVGRVEREVSLRLLRHLASSVHHQQYRDTDIVTVRVEATAPDG